MIETSHLMGSIDGVLLLLLAYRLQQRSRSAWALSAVLLCVGAVSLMLKGFAWEEASVARAAPPCLAARRTGVSARKLITSSGVRIWLVSRDRRCARHRVLARLVFLQTPR